MDRRLLRRVPVGLDIVLGLTACANVPGGAPTTAHVAESGSSLQAHGAAVFRLQNAVMDELIGAAELESGLTDAAAQGLAAAEARMVERCRAINEAASIRASGGEPGLLLKLRVLDSLAPCENAALTARACLRSDPSHLRASTP